MQRKTDETGLRCLLFLLLAAACVWCLLAPEAPRFELRSCDAAGFANAGVFKPACRLKYQRSRLFRVGTAGQRQQQYDPPT